MSIIENRKAFHDYFIEEKHEAGMVLEGWEVKAIRAGRANIKESYVVIRGEEIFLFGMHITPLSTASSHVSHDPTRTRKLLLHKKEIARLIGKVERAGYTLVPIDMHFKQVGSSSRSGWRRARSCTTSARTRRRRTGIARSSA